jgi:probable rRNA maturation factor
LERSVQFFSENIEHPFSPAEEEGLFRWLSGIVQAEKGELRALTYIFCDDAYLHRLNVEYLDHDTLTDVITFPYQAPPVVEGDVFISVERTRDNAQDLGASPDTELRRVMAHGLLHLLGYGDKTPEEQRTMRAKEDFHLAGWAASVAP